MGLDMYAYAVNANECVVNTRTGTVVAQDGAHVTQIAYWRKHNALHGWMYSLYTQYNELAEADLFNCTTLVLTKDDLDTLETAVIGGALPKTGGFFFGEDTSTDNPYYDDDLAFIKEARAQIESGKVVYYDSWW